MAFVFFTVPNPPTSPHQNALMTYTRAVAEICLQHLIKSATLQSDQFALQYSSVTEGSTRTHTDVQQHGNKGVGMLFVLIKTMSFSKAIYTSMKGPVTDFSFWKNVSGVCANHAFTAHSADNLYLPWTKSQHWNEANCILQQAPRGYVRHLNHSAVWQAFTSASENFCY